MDLFIQITWPELDALFGIMMGLLLLPRVSKSIAALLTCLSSEVLNLVLMLQKISWMLLLV
ncbi:hypothetical protein KSP40_PGU003062 [Platanthera guangdongensis]|uniref:Uncharacterized protein n=1 Tax=Platanthera guangdongensis TaxID=2320717 RepID=A0ABR2N2L8_9ASPA